MQSFIRFVEFLEEITNPHSSIVWAPNQQNFLNVALSKQYLSAHASGNNDTNSHSSVRMELFLDNVISFIIFFFFLFIIIIYQF